MSIRIDWRDIPRLILSDKKKIGRAAAKTLTGLAFDSLPEITTHANLRLDIEKDTRRALGMRVVRRATPQRLVSIVGTDRGWLFYHLNKGTRRANKGIVHRGIKYLMYPVEDRAFTKRGRLKASYARRTFIVSRGKGALMFYRPRGRGSDAIVIGTLSRKFRYHKELSPEDVVSEVVRRKGARLFRLFMDKERRRVR